MWNRACPMCFVKLPSALVLAQSEELVCPSCHTELELSRPSRVLAAVTGLLGGAAGASTVVTRGVHGGWALGVVAAVLAFGAAAALTLLLVSDVAVRPEVAAAFPHPH
jgi:hypothetical protein